jgi:site-specific DNA-methyltransferase (adenine-specific)
LEGTVAENVQKWGTGAMNVDGCRVKWAGTKDAAAAAAAAAVGFRRSQSNGAETISYGKIRRENVPTYDSSVPGRWPANLIHDGSEEVLELFPETKSGARNAGYVHKNYAMNWGLKTGMACESSSGSGARFFYCAKASRKEREAGLEGIEIKKGNPNLISSKTVIRGHPENGKPTPSENKPPLSIHNNHPTVKPLALMRYLCRLVTPPGGTILDPFMGSGSTGMAAKAEGFEFIGIEINPDYFKIAEKRIAVIST